MKTTTSMIRIGVLLSMLVLLPSVMQASQWVGSDATGNGDWTDLGSWDPYPGEVPNGPGAVADFTGTYGGLITVKLKDEQISVGTLRLGSTENTYTIAFRNNFITASGNSVLTFDNNGSAALLSTQHNGQYMLFGAGSNIGNADDRWSRAVQHMGLSDSLNIERKGTGNLDMHVHIGATDGGNHTITILDTSTTGGVVNFMGAGNATADNWSRIHDGNGKVSVKQASSNTQLYLYGNNDYSGGTEITNGGRIQINNDGNLGAAGGELRFSGEGGVLAVVGGDPNALQTSRNIILQDSNTVGKIDHSQGAWAGHRYLNGTISGEGTLYLADRNMNSGRMSYLNAENTYKGGTILESVWLQIQGDKNLGDASGDLQFVGVGGTVSLEGNDAVLQTSRNIVLRDSTTVARIDHSKGSWDVARYLNGTISGEGSLYLADRNVHSNRITYINGQNTFKGGITIQNSRTRAKTDSALGASTGAVALKTAHLELGESTAAGEVSRRALSLEGAIIIQPNTTTAWEWAGIISGTGTLDKQGASNMIFSAANTYAGAINVTNGVLFFNNASGSGAGTADVTITGYRRGIGGSGSISGNVSTSASTTVMQVGYGNKAGFKIGGSYILGGNLEISYGDVFGTLEIGNILNLNNKLVSFDLSGYTGGDIDLISFNSLENGTLASFSFTGISSSDYYLDLSAGALSLRAIPEPGTYAMALALGVLGFIALRRYRKRSR